jgi:hypothetical protein
MVSISRRQFLVRSLTALAGSSLLSAPARPAAAALARPAYSTGIPLPLADLSLPPSYTPVPATPFRLPRADATPVPLPGRAELMAHWPAVDKSRVVLVRHAGVLASGEPNPDIVLQMLDAGISALADGAEALAVWRTLFDPTERVLLKVNCISSGGPTQPAVAYAVAQRLQDAGLAPENLLIFDRTDGELADAGYQMNEGGSGLQCHGARGEGSEAALTQATVRFYQELDSCDAIINLPTPKSHGMAGVSCALKNHYGSVNSPGELHGGGCDPAIPELNAQPVVRDKTRLCVGAALKVSPGDWYTPEPENALLLAFDPVALDTVARDILVRHIQAAGNAPSGVVERSHHLATAQSMQLGAAEAAPIDLREVVLA